MQTKVIYSEKCLDYGSWHIEGPQRVKLAAKVLKEKGREFLEPKPSSDEILLTVHDADYINSLKRGTVEDSDTPAYDNIYELAKLSVGGALLASEIQGFSLMRPPGHHVGRNGAALGASTRGFCYLNNIAIAVKRLDKTTLILDIDGHHGNGTQEIFQGNEKVFYLSLHQSPNYPGTGSVSEGNCINFALPPNIGGQQYLKTLDKALSLIQPSQFETVAVSCGFDTHSGDLATLGLVEHDYWQIGKRVALLRKPAFFVLEGGYMGQKIGLDIDSLLTGYEINREK